MPTQKRLRGHNRSIAHDAEVVDEPSSLRQPSNNDPPTKRATAILQSCASNTVTGASKITLSNAGAALTASGSSTVSDSANESIFLFKHFREGNSRVTRSRPLSACKDAKLLFAHAFARSIATESTLVLSVQVNEREPIKVVKGDDEDFNQIKQELRLEGTEKQIQIIVTAEDITI